MAGTTVFRPGGCGLASFGELLADPGLGASGTGPQAQQVLTTAPASLTAPFEVQRMGLTPWKQAVNQAREKKLSTWVDLW